MAALTHAHVQRLPHADGLAAIRGEWNALARGVPFRRLEWLEAWWQAYGTLPENELHVLAVYEAGQLIGLAPWYLERRGRQRVLQFLGSGEVCTDYLTLLCSPGREADVAEAIAGWLCRAPSETTTEAPAWDQLELSAIHTGDPALTALLDQLQQRGKLIQYRNVTNSWRIELPATWEEYLAGLSKSHRKKIRRLERQYFESGRARLHVASQEAELVEGLQIFTALHQQRRESLGEPGCFASTHFAKFHELATRSLWQAGLLRLAWLTIDGLAVAADYHLLGDDVSYAYQAGIAPDALHHEPGRLITAALVKQACEERRRAFDFLRGDEPYKSQWRAVPRPMRDVCVAADTPVARLRYGLWQAGDSVKSWIKSLPYAGALSS